MWKWLQRFRCYDIRILIWLHQMNNQRKQSLSVLGQYSGLIFRKNKFNKCAKQSAFLFELRWQSSALRIKKWDHLLISITNLLWHRFHRIEWKMTVQLADKPLAMICYWPFSLNHLAHSEFNHAKESVALSNVFAKELQPSNQDEQI